MMEFVNISNGLKTMNSNHEEVTRILHVFGIMDRGGAESFIMSVYRNIDRTKVQFDFVVHNSKKGDFDDEIRQLGGRIFILPRYKIYNHSQYKKTWESLLTDHPEFQLIHGHVRSTASIYVNIAHSMQRQCIIHSHSTGSRGNIVERSVKKIFQKNLDQRADFMFSCSQEAGKWLFGEGALSSPNYYYIPNAIDLDHYNFKPSIRHELRSQFNLNDSTLLLGHVGNFMEAKNHPFMIELLAMLRENGNDVSLMLVGTGPLEKAIKQQAKERGVLESILFMGATKDVSSLLNTMDLFLFPSLFEGLGIALIEAQANGLPSLVSNHIPVEAIITETTKVVPLDNNLWYQSIKEFIPDAINRTDSLPDLVEAGYDIKTVTMKLQTFYLNATKKRG